VRRSTAVNVNAQALRNRTSTLVQSWFRGVRPYLEGIGIPPERMIVVDTAMQRLLRLSLAPNAKASYLGELDTVRTAWPELVLDVEQHRGQLILRAAASKIQISEVERRILETLPRIGLPDAIQSYQQVLIDLAEANRLSYRGTATELREVVREVLDHLAPDADVMAAPGFKLLEGQKGPTMVQKARFILKARGMGESARKAPEDAVALLEEQIASLARSTYVKGSAATHSVTTLEKARGFKGYADAVLAELLQVHRQ
jgi:predicted pPIWI-associating nuclease